MELHVLLQHCTECKKWVQEWADFSARIKVCFPYLVTTYIVNNVVNVRKINQLNFSINVGENEPIAIKKKQHVTKAEKANEKQLRLFPVINK